VEIPNVQPGPSGPAPLNSLRSNNFSCWLIFCSDNPVWDGIELIDLSLNTGGKSNFMAGSFELSPPGVGGSTP
jgi:hypothetical protein